MHLMLRSSSISYSKYSIYLHNFNFCLRCESPRSPSSDILKSFDVCDLANYVPKSGIKPGCLVHAFETFFNVNHISN